MGARGGPATVSSLHFALLGWLSLTTPRRQPRTDNCAYRRLRVGAAHRELFRQRSQRYLSTGYDFKSAPAAMAATSALFYSNRAPNSGARTKMDSGGSGKIATLVPPRDRYTRFLDDPGPIQLTLAPLLTVRRPGTALWVRDVFNFTKEAPSPP